MKHKIAKYCIFSLSLTMGAVFTGCIEETFPSQSATSEQVAADPKSLESIVNSIAHYTIETATYGSRDYKDGALPAT